MSATNNGVTQRTSLRDTRRENFWSVYGIPIVFVVICVVLSFTTRSFASIDNVINILRQISILSVAGVGTTLILISGGIDVSQGAVMAASGMAAMALIAHGGWPYPLATVAGLAVGLVAGLFNGLIITKVRIPPFIATLGTMSILRGVAFVYSGGYTVYGNYIPEGLPGDWTGIRQLHPDPGYHHAHHVRGCLLLRELHEPRDLHVRDRMQREGQQAGGHQGRSRQDYPVRDRRADGSPLRNHPHGSPELRPGKCRERPGVRHHHRGRARRHKHLRRQGEDSSDPAWSSDDGCDE